MLRSHGMAREIDDPIKKEVWSNSYPDLNEKFIFTRPAFNVRNNEIGAIIGLEQLKRLDSMIKRDLIILSIFLIYYLIGALKISILVAKVIMLLI